MDIDDLKTAAQREQLLTALHVLKKKDNCRNLCEGPVPSDPDTADQSRTQELPDD